MEVGPIARLYASALLGKVHIESPWAEVRAGNGRIKISLPKTKSELLKPSLFDEAEFEWKIPEIRTDGNIPAVNVIERNRARAYSHAYYAAAAFSSINRILNYIGKF